MEGKKISGYSAALVDINQALKLEPQNAQYLQQKASVLDDLDETERGLSCVEEALKLDPQLALAWQTKANILDHLGRSAEAVAAAAHAVELEPDGNTYLLLSAILAHQQKYEEAEAVLDRAVKYNTLDVITRGRRATIAKHTHHWDKAIADLTFVINTKEKDGDRSFTYHNAIQERADTYIQARRYNEAIIDCKQALKIFPDNRQIHNSLLAAYKATGNKAGTAAEERALKALDVDFQPLR